MGTFTNILKSSVQRRNWKELYEKVLRENAKLKFKILNIKKLLDENAVEVPK